MNRQRRGVRSTRQRRHRRGSRSESSIFQLLLWSVANRTAMEEEMASCERKNEKKDVLVWLPDHTHQAVQLSCASET
jgi:hypothetical protein